jgi:hypothetical protein
MKSNLLEQIAEVHWQPNGAPEGEFGLNLTVVYEDAATRQWAGKVCKRVAKLVGKEAIHSTWWRLGELREPAVLAGAVSKAIRADVILVAAQAFEVFPAPFYVWISSWLPHRLRRSGALVALAATPAGSNRCGNQAPHFHYLRSVARQARLDFVVEELPLKVRAPGIQNGRTRRNGRVAVQRLARPRVHRYERW